MILQCRVQPGRAFRRNIHRHRKPNGNYPRGLPSEAHEPSIIFCLVLVYYAVDPYLLFFLAFNPNQERSGDACEIERRLAGIDAKGLLGAA